MGNRCAECRQNKHNEYKAPEFDPSVDLAQETETISTFQKINLTKIL